MKKTNIQPKLLNSEDAAVYLGLSKRTLETWRCKQKYNIPYVKIGNAVRYVIDDLNAYVERQKVNFDNFIA
jgi:hypothetical protein